MGNGQKGNSGALGLIETQGRAPLIEAVDNAIKAANVTLKASYFVGGGTNAVTLVGDVGAMRAALDAAQATIDRYGVDGKTHLIPRLAPEVWAILEVSPEAPAPVKPVPKKVVPPEAVVPAADAAPAEEKPASPPKKPRKPKS
jgi:microcompartment protein CcmL/EutN